jgi:hypothetical protein
VVVVNVIAVATHGLDDSEVGWARRDERLFIMHHTDGWMGGWMGGWAGGGTWMGPVIGVLLLVLLVVVIVAMSKK